MQIITFTMQLSPKKIAHTYHKTHNTLLICIYMDTHLPTHTSECFHFGMFAFLWMSDMLTWTWHICCLFFCNVCFPVMPGSSEGSVDRLCDLCERLHGTLAEADMLGRRCKRRSGILRALFRLIDLNSAQLNLHIAKLCLAVSCRCLFGCVGVSMSASKSQPQGHPGHFWALNTKVGWSCFAFSSPAVCQWKQPAQHL